MHLSNILLFALSTTTQLTLAVPINQLEDRGNAISGPVADATYTTVKNCAGITAVACGFAGDIPNMRIAGAVSVAASCAEGCVKWKRIYDQQQKDKASKATKDKADLEKGKDTTTPVGNAPVGGKWNPKTGKWDVERPKPKKANTY